MEDLKLTQLEEQVLTSIIDSLYAEAGFSDIDATDVANDTGIDIKRVRGVVGSLVNKGIIFTDESSTFGAQHYNLIYLSKNYYYLHPEWSKEGLA